MDFNSELLKKVDELEEIIYGFLPSIKDHQKIISDAMSYSVKAGGKRIRPMLMNETYKLFKGGKIDIEPFIAAMEMIHTYSLVHDDLPAMDDDDFRRGKRTTHKVFGEAMGILAGDALLNYAFEIMSKAVVNSSDIPKSALAMYEMSKCAGVYGMIGGQVVDVESNGENLEKDKLDFIYKLKTGALIEASMVIGAILAETNNENIEVIRCVAKDVGMAFQIQDDILDVISTTEKLGKPVLSDEKNQKTTYVTIMGIEEAGKEVEKLSKKALNNLEKISGDKEFLMNLIIKLINREK